MHANGRKIFRKFTVFKSLASGISSFFGCIASMQNCGDLGCENFLRFVDFGTTESCQLSNFIQWQRCVELQEAFYVSVFCIAPLLPKVIGAEHPFVKPARAAYRLAHFLACSSGQQMRG